MKKKILGLCLLFTMLFGSVVTVYAEDTAPLVESNGITYIEGHEPDNTPNFTIPPTGELSSECGANGNMTFYLYVAEENKNQITRIVFLDKNTGDEYFYKFNPVNYNDDTLWAQHINIPQGEYYVSARVSGDNYGAFSCSLYPEGTLQVGHMLKTVVCLVGPKEWINTTYARMEKEKAEATPTPGPTATPEPEATPDLEELERLKLDELIRKQILYEEEQARIQEEKTKKNRVVYGVIIGVVVVIAGVVLVKKRKKK